MADQKKNMLRLPADEYRDRMIKLVRSGVTPEEAKARLRQSAADRAVSSTMQTKSVLKSSLKSEVFRPNFGGKMSVAKSRLSGPSSFKRAEQLQFDIVNKRRLDQQKALAIQRKNVEKAFKQHPREAERIRQVVLHKTPEERERKHHEKKERRRMARELTGSSKGEWYDPIVKMGADLIPKLLPMLIGMGDYTDPEDIPMKSGSVPNSNSFLAATTGGRSGYEVPFMHSHGEKTRVTHREYVGDVYSSTSAFTTVSFPINPGMEELFPWCSPVANSYTNYRLMGAVVDFVSQGSDYANVAGLGYVALATQYNPLDAPFLDKREMLNYEFADAVKPSRNMTHWIECKPSDVPEPEKSVRAGNVPANADIRLYDHGKLWLAVGGNTAGGSIIGQLWISYDLEFYFPKISGSAAGVLDYSFVVRTGSAPLIYFGTATSVVDPRTTISFVYTGSTITFPNALRGDFQINLVWTGGVASAGVVIPTFTINGSNTVSVVVWDTGAAGLMSYSMTLWVSLREDAAVLTGVANASSLPSGGGTCYITISQIPRAPAVNSSEIFDPQGLEADSRYSSFMEMVKQKELVSMGMKGEPPKRLSVLSPKPTLCDSPDDEDDDPLQLKRVGKYGLYIIGDSYFIVDTHGLDDSEWFFLDCNDSVHRSLVNDYEDMTAKDFTRAAKYVIAYYKAILVSLPDLTPKSTSSSSTTSEEVLREFEGHKLVRFKSSDSEWVAVERPIEKDASTFVACSLDSENSFDSLFCSGFAGMNGKEFKTTIDSVFARRAKLESLVGSQAANDLDLAMRKRSPKI